MPGNIIDLRKPDQKPEFSIPDPRPATPQLKPIPAVPQGRPEKGASLIEWQTREYERRARGPHWFLAPGGIALLLILFGIFTRSYFFIALITLAFIVILLYARREPQELSFAIREEGVQAGRRFYPFPTLKSFWIFEERLPKELSLETEQRILPFLTLPLGDADPETIRRVLSRILPEEKHQESVSELLLRSLGL